MTNIERKPFQPIGEKPQAAMIYDHLAVMDVGDVITYEELADILGVDDFTKHRQPFYKAVAELEDSNKRTLANVPKIGYRVVEAIEHEGLARGHHRRGKNQLKKAERKLRSADRSRMSTQDRQRFDNLELAVSRQRDMIRRLDGRVARVEDAVQLSRAEQAAQRKDSEQLQRQIVRLREALQRHNIPVDDDDQDDTGTPS